MNIKKMKEARDFWEAKYKETEGQPGREAVLEAAATQIELAEKLIQEQIDTATESECIAAMEEMARGGYTESDMQSVIVRLNALNLK